MTSDVIYRLPKSVLVVSGVVRTHLDELEVSKPKSVLSIIDISLVTEADTTTPLTLTPRKGRLWTYKSSFSVAADGRLCSASSDTTSELGTVLKSVASIAGAVTGLFALSDDGTKDDLDNRTITDGYAAEYAEVHARLVQMRSRRTQTQSLLLDALGKPETDAGDLRRLRQRVAMLDEQLVPLVAHFRTWRESKISTTDAPFDFRVDLSSISTADPQLPNNAQPPKDPKPVDLASLWALYGYTVQAQWLEFQDGTRPKRQNHTYTKRGSDTVYVRRPEQLELRIHHKVDKTVACITRSRHAVADDNSVEAAYTLEKSWFGRRSISLAFDASGFVTTVSTEGTSGAAVALATLAGLPEGFAGGVESTTKAYGRVQAAGRASIEAETARVKADVERRQQRLLGAGLNATAEDTAELLRLQQIRGILEAQTAIRGTDPSLVATLTQRAHGDLDWYTRPQPPEAAEPQMIRIVIGEQAAESRSVTTPVNPPTLGDQT